MCSISGAISATYNTAHDLKAIVQKMNAAQRHRGPDDRGVAECEVHPCDVVLGNTRLAIIDTSSAGHQPMCDQETGNWITYNGETYNFKALRQEIGRSWLSNSDTEVVLHAYRKWGIDAFARMRGMFALAIWDNANRTLVLARDPLGIKPLYYCVARNQLLFASELRALLSTGLLERRLSRNGVDSYLANGSVESPLTIMEGIRQLLPGHCLQVSVNKSELLELGDSEFAKSRTRSDETNRTEAVVRLRAELEESIKLHLVSDVPLGVFLSGGMDSSALVALMSQMTNQKAKTFSVIFDEATFTEAPFSRAIANRFETDHTEIRLRENRLFELLPDAISAIDQPTMDGINTYIVAKSVKDAGLTVALSGLGGDELFAGYPSFRRALRFNSMSDTSRRILRKAAEIGRRAFEGSVRRQKVWQLVNSNGFPSDVYRISRQLFANDFVSEMTGQDVLLNTNGNRNPSDTVNAMSVLEMRGYMTNTLLRDTDAMSMAHSLEVRVPFVDIKLVDYVLSLPGEWKLKNTNEKPKSLLADALTDLLPRDLLIRPKMGFTLPFEKWMRLNLRREMSSTLTDAIHLAACGLRLKPVKTIWDTFLERPSAVGWSRPWSLYVLVKWCELNQVSI